MVKKKDVRLNHLLYEVYKKDEKENMKTKLITLEDLLKAVQLNDEKEINNRFRIVF